MSDALMDVCCGPNQFLLKTPILDACCGPKMFHFNKKNPLVLYNDLRREKIKSCDGRIIEISPDVNYDFCNMPFPNDTFNLVIFDPPHLKGAGRKSFLAQKYGCLSKKDWPIDIKKGFDECMRVLKSGGTLVFKWNEHSIKVSDLIAVLGAEPVVGHRTRQASKTIWMLFYKI